MPTSGNEVYLGGTIRWENKFRDFATRGESQGSVISPSTHDITLYDPDGVEIFTSTAPSSATDASDELYFYVDIEVPEDADAGNWKLLWKATHGSNKWINKRIFAIESP